MLLIFLLPILSYASMLDYFHGFVDHMDSSTEILSIEFKNILNSIDYYMENNDIKSCFENDCLGTDCRKVKYPITEQDRVYATISKGVYLKKTPEYISNIGNVVKYTGESARVNETYQYYLVDNADILDDDSSPEWVVYSEKGTPQNIIIGFRGTFHSRDIGTDVDIGNGKLKTSDRFKRNYKALFEKIKTANTIVFTGHSLGGALAVETLKMVYPEYSSKAVIFNAGYSCSNNVNASLPIRSWRTEGDIVSFMGIGKYNEEYLVTNDFLHIMHISRNPLDRHSMDIFTHCPEHYKPKDSSDIPFCVRGYSVYESGAHSWLIPLSFILGIFVLCYCCIAKKKTHYNYFGGLDNYNDNFDEMDRKIIIF